MQASQSAKIQCTALLAKFVTLPRTRFPGEALSCGVLPEFRHDFLGHVVANVRAHRGGVVLMHETHETSVATLDALIVKLEAEGYRFSTPAAQEFAASLR